MARLCSSRARKLQPPTCGLRAQSGTGDSLDGVLSQGEASSNLGPWSLSVFSFTQAQGSVLIFLRQCYQSEKGRHLPVQLKPKESIGQKVPFPARWITFRQISESIKTG